eukprot:CAMPEP_0117070478 /NCGR_PEP_ID=MMETSP0472-20121206/49516_1 /TAXON_ID=693140 ORGANISM="Tiarina fusus, Strain LIS" /NCGR_SAMPLE_ID=MMETSP0472 /ASSEMBLY_ACC=CAM_ASM_000603 /LENGTH=87 /DNA_ID=CAMNT_0004793603 /DNA_START=23 /DNA_END=286 /DNA_ORIENTATION=+
MPKKKKLETPTNKLNENPKSSERNANKQAKLSSVAIMNENPKSSEFDPNHFTVEELKKVIEPSTSTSKEKKLPSMKKVTENPKAARY